MKGVFISFEGPDGSGKTTQIKRLAEHCKNLGYDVIVTREPGGTAISEKIRSLILDPENMEMAPAAEALLYAASRAQLVKQLIMPALDEGKIVLCDRFMDSSIAYQGFARGLGDGVRVINEFAIQSLQPDITFFLDIDPAQGRSRNRKEGKADRMELEDIKFHQAVYEGYLAISEMYKDRYIKIDASHPLDDVAKAVADNFDKYVADRA